MNRIAALSAVLATGAVAGPVLAANPHGDGTTGKSQGKGHAYGKKCKGKSKKHVKGEKGTEFSRCVKAHQPPVTGPSGPTGPTGMTGPTGTATR